MLFFIIKVSTAGLKRCANYLLIGLDRQFLHAKTLGFFHPQRKEKMIFDSNLPNELNNILKKLGKTKKLNH